jgi:hypothetical protein
LGKDKIRHLVERRNKQGDVRFFWQPSLTILALGFAPEALGIDAAKAKSRAAELNGIADEARRASKSGSNGPLPGTMAKLFADYQLSDEFTDELKPRTKKDYIYYLSKIEIDLGHTMVRAHTPKSIKEYYRRVRREVSVTWGYHILAMLRTVLSWAVSENWIPKNPALDVSLKAPKKRTVVWTAAQSATYVEKAKELGWHSIVAMAYIFDCIGQSPVDVRTMTREAYDGKRIDVTRAKTGQGGAPIPLFPDAKRALDAYLNTQPGKLPNAPLFTCETTGAMWNESTLQKKHAIIRKAAGLPFELQLQDFRTTVQTEGGAAGGTVDELRGLARHSSRDAAEHYVHPDERYTAAIQKCVSSEHLGQLRA